MDNRGWQDKEFKNYVKQNDNYWVNKNRSAKGYQNWKSTAGFRKGDKKNE